MKLLTATREGQGERSGDFFHAIEGEVVILGEVCATDQNDPLRGLWMRAGILRAAFPAGDDHCTGAETRPRS